MVRAREKYSNARLDIGEMFKNGEKVVVEEK